MEDISAGVGKTWTVSELNQAARDLLQERFSPVRVEGEISNFRLYPSGHAYFSLKDSDGQLAAAMFRFASRGLRFDVKDGLAVVAAGELTIYDRRGQYQLVVESMEPKGKGALQLAFEQLKEKLQLEGLFDEDRKKPLPFLPERIGVVTSSRGAAVEDIINVLTRRFPGVAILINPVRVQGEGAAGEIAAAVAEFNAMKAADVLIVGRGGGSIEDLWAFNEEVVARAIAASSIPVVSAVGHETDFTIADFVADLRAPTPSAAAELVVKSRESLQNEVDGLARSISTAAGRQIRNGRQRLEALAVHRMIGDKRRYLRERVQIVDDLHHELCRAVRESVSSRRRMLDAFREALAHLSPRTRHALLRERYLNAAQRLEVAVRSPLRERKEQSSRLAAQMEALSPLGVLARGYGICRRLPSLAVIRDAGTVKPGGDVTVRLHRGELRCRVTEVLPSGDG